MKLELVWRSVLTSRSSYMLSQGQASSLTGLPHAPQVGSLSHNFGRATDFEYSTQYEIPSEAFPERPTFPRFFLV